MWVSSGLRGIGVCLLLILPSAHGQSGSPGYPPTSGIHFQTSCDPAAQARFDHAVELLHSFEYPVSEQEFRSILQSEPSCAMARWGIAMNQWHPLWAPPSPAALELGAGMLAAIDRSALSRRESMYVDALLRFFSQADSTPHQERVIAYSRAMGDLYRENRTDREVVAFYALSLLATVDPADRTHCVQYEAAGLLNWLLDEDPHHPGGLHYLIHAYDYPGLAHLALGAAESYAAVAPDSAHAQHMPSHIFTRLGLWDRSIGSNHDSTASAAHYTEQAGLPGYYDEGIHSIDYLMYANLQVAADDDARQVLDGLRALGRAHPETFKVAYAYAASPARYALERREWREASRLELLPQDFPWSEFQWAQSIHHFARGIGAARSGEMSLAGRELQEIRHIEATLPVQTLTYWREQVRVQGDAVESWIALAQGDADTALHLAEAAAEREDAVDKHPVTPGEVLPARELLADMLLELGQADRARGAYEAVLERSPNRLNALLGAGEASVQLGDSTAARIYYRAAIGQSAAGNQGRPRLQQAITFVSLQPDTRR